MEFQFKAKILLQRSDEISHLIRVSQTAPSYYLYGFRKLTPKKHYCKSQKPIHVLTFYSVLPILSVSELLKDTTFFVTSPRHRVFSK